jgi:DNA ligase (NAD+)
MNKKVVVTGTLPNFTRLQMYEVLRKLGVQIVESVSKKTDYVLVGDNPGSKAEKARQLGIKILNQNDILNEINQKKE